MFAGILKMTVPDISSWSFSSRQTIVHPIIQKKVKEARCSGGQLRPRRSASTRWRRGSQHRVFGSCVASAVRKEINILLLLRILDVNNRARCLTINQIIRTKLYNNYFTFVYKKVIYYYVVPWVTFPFLLLLTHYSLGLQIPIFLCPTWCYNKSRALFSLLSSSL